MNNIKKTITLGTTVFLFLAASLFFAPLKTHAAPGVPFPVIGQVTDGLAPVDGAIVTLTNNRTGEIFSMTTAAGGWYQFELTVPPLAAGDVISLEAFFLNLIGTGTYTYNGVDAFTQVNIIMNVPADTTPPVITLLGANPTDVIQNSVFGDPGATATDNIDGNISANIVVTGTVNTAIIGQYLLSYDVSDAAGNAATTITRTINVVAGITDIMPPVITLLGIDPIDIIQNSVWSDPGATAMDDVDGDISANIVVTGTVDTATIGQYLLNYDVSDVAGNPALTVTRTVNVIADPFFDAIPPIIILIGANPMDVLQNSVFTDPGAQALDDVDGDISANILVTGIVDTAIIGQYLLSYDVFDAAGNAAWTEIRTVNVVAAPPAPDIIPPVITLLGANPMDVLQNSVFTDPGATAIDDVDGNISTNIAVTGIVDTATLGQYLLTYNVSDAALNAAVSVVRTVNVVATPATPDITPPVITLLGANPMDVSQSSVWSDPGATAVDDIDGNISANIVVTGVVDTAILGQYLLTYNVSDVALNSALTVTRTVNVVAAPPAPDIIPPVITLLGANPMDVLQNSVFTDPGATAIDDVDGNISTNIAVTGIVDTATLGQYLLTYNVSDAALNAAVSVIRTVNVTVASTSDMTPPIITLLGNNPTDVAQDSTFTDPGAIVTDDVDGNISANIVVTGTVNTATIGEHFLTYNVSDAAGNAAIAVVRKVIVRETKARRGGGGGGGGGGGSVVSSFTKPENFKAVWNKENYLLRWINPNDNNFSKVVVVRKEGSAPMGTSDGMVIYEGKDSQYLDKISDGKSYYYGIMSYNASGNSSQFVLADSEREIGEIFVGHLAALGDDDKKMDDREDLYGISSELASQISSEEANIITEQNNLAPLNSNEQKLYDKVAGINNSLSSEIKAAVSYFIVAGTPTTKRLGAGERAGLISSFVSAYGRLPQDDDWEEIIKIGNGRFPKRRVAFLEEKARSIFQKVYARSASKDTYDVNAISIMAYGLRPVKRNLDSEKAALHSFAAIHGKLPATSTDWDILRAIAYSGAKK